MPKRTIVLLLLLSLRQQAFVTRRYNKLIGSVRTTAHERACITALVKRAGSIAFNFVYIVKPATVRGWLKEFSISILSIKSRWGKIKSRIKQRLGLIPRPGRKPLDRTIIAAIIKIKKENMHYGADKIRGELWKNNIFVSRAAINKILKKYFPYQPRRKKRSQLDEHLTWKQFFFALKEGIHAIDLFSVFSLFGRQIFCLIIIDHANRKCIHFAFSARPNPAWVWCEIQRAYTHNRIPETIIADNDGNFSPWLARKVKDRLGIHIHRTTPQSPWENGVAERFIRTVREELFDRLPPVLGCNHGEKLMKHFIAFYNQHRTHSTLNYDSPDGREYQGSPANIHDLKTISLFHGLWNYYLPA